MGSGARQAIDESGFYRETIGFTFDVRPLLGPADHAILSHWALFPGCQALAARSVDGQTDGPLRSVCHKGRGNHRGHVPR
jgi:hypothetical protein